MSEIVPLSKAIETLVRDGHHVALEGFTHLIPHAAGHEIIRQGKRDLTLYRMTPDLVYDQLIGMGVARKLVFSWDCFVGIGLPSKAANLARLTHAPEAVLIYESGPIGAKPSVLPLSIGDGELSTTADTTVSTAEIFTYWLQGGWVDVGFLGAAQIDRFANINTTVIGPYQKPKVRLPGAGGAPEIAALAKEVLIILRQTPKAFVNKLDFVTSMGHGQGFDHRERLGFSTKGPTAVITDLGVLTPDEHSKELTLTTIHPGVTLEQVRAATAWELQISDKLQVTPPPDPEELRVLRDLEARTAQAHKRKING